jgi:hypothetical protein
MSRLELGDWFACPQYYDFEHTISVAERELADGGGQVMALICGFEWEIHVLEQTAQHEWGVVRLCYKPPRNDADQRCYPELEPWQQHSAPIRYKITNGLFVLPGQMDRFQPQVFGAKLELEADPFPARRAAYGLFQLLEPIAASEHRVFYGARNRALTIALGQGQAELARAVRKLKRRAPPWNPKAALRRSQCISLWLPNLLEAFRDA